MKTCEFVPFVLGHGLTYILLNDFPFETLENPNLAILCKDASNILKQIMGIIEEDLRDVVHNKI